MYMYMCPAPPTFYPLISFFPVFPPTPYLVDPRIRRLPVRIYPRVRFGPRRCLSFTHPANIALKDRHRIPIPPSLRPHDARRRRSPRTHARTHTSRACYDVYIRVYSGIFEYSVEYLVPTSLIEASSFRVTVREPPPPPPSASSRPTVARHTTHEPRIRRNIPA